MTRRYIALPPGQRIHGQSKAVEKAARRLIACHGTAAAALEALRPAMARLHDQCLERHEPVEWERLDSRRNLARALVYAAEALEVLGDDIDAEPLLGRGPAGGRP